MVSIIILSYNTKELLEKCLNSIFLQTFDISFEVIVVDNASKDSSVEMIKKKFKDVLLIESKKNLGFSAGVNKGVEVAKGDLLLFLNSDTIFQKGKFYDVIGLFNNEKKIGVVGGLQIDQNGKTRISSGKAFSIFNFPIIGFSYLTNSGSMPDESLQEVEWVNGACMFIKKELFNQLGGFDEHFFMYMEDMELCFRVRKFGYRVVLFSDFVVSHVELGSSNRTFAIVEIYKGVLYFFKKHKNPVEYSIARFILMVKAALLSLVGFITGNKYLSATYTQALRETL